MFSMACDAQTTLYRSGRETGSRNQGKGSADKAADMLLQKAEHQPALWEDCCHYFDSARLLLDQKTQSQKYQHCQLMTEYCEEFFNSSQTEQTPVLSSEQKSVSQDEEAVNETGVLTQPEVRRCIGSLYSTLLHINNLDAGFDQTRKGKKTKAGNSLFDKADAMNPGRIARGLKKYQPGPGKVTVDDPETFALKKSAF